MGPYLKNDKMMMYYFQESLKDSAIRWYLNLGKKEIRTWHDLANAFVRHYKHNIGCAPDKSSLRKLKMHKYPLVFVHQYTIHNTVRRRRSSSRHPNNKHQSNDETILQLHSILL